MLKDLAAMVGLGIRRSGAAGLEINREVRLRGTSRRGAEGLMTGVVDDLPVSTEDSSDRLCGDFKVCMLDILPEQDCAWLSRETRCLRSSVSGSSDCLRAAVSDSILDNVPCADLTGKCCCACVALISEAFLGLVAALPSPSSFIHESSARVTCGRLGSSMNFERPTSSRTVFFGDAGGCIGLLKGVLNADVGLAGSGNFDCFACSSAFRGLNGGLGIIDMCFL